MWSPRVWQAVLALKKLTVWWGSQITLFYSSPNPQTSMLFSVTPVPAPGPEVWPPEGWVSTGGGGGEGRRGVVTGTSADVADFYST